ncbi:uncharacterized protein LOC142903302 [Nelusetta ayraudi]|uniref:uncharacterized protein LOC142903302 n=1 Tax=Nelusetta ayraudi TaxID=303726 RepID=UPI003F6F8DC7
MKFPGDLCRRLLLGLRAEEPAEETRVQDGNSDQDLTDRRQQAGSSQERLASEEGLDEEERTRRRAERRRAKKRRQKERRKQERAERMEDGAGQEEVEECVAAASQSVRKEQRGWTARSPQSLPAHQRAQSGGNCRQPDEVGWPEPEWDVSSAFVAKVANHIRLRSQMGGATVSSSREDEENEGSGSQGAEVKRRGEALTAKGIQLFGKSRYSHALAIFTEAIHCDPKDYRFYGNRSFCYLCLEKHQPALADALRSIQLAPDWPKGYFRKGCALMALKRYPEAEQALEQVLELDPRCKEAPIKLLRCRLLQLTALGLDKEQGQGRSDTDRGVIFWGF